MQGNAQCLSVGHSQMNFINKECKQYIQITYSTDVIFCERLRKKMSLLDHQLQYGIMITIVLVHGSVSICKQYLLISLHCFGTPQLYHVFSFPKLSQNINRAKLQLCQVDNSSYLLVNFHIQGFMIFKKNPPNTLILFS